MLCLLMSNGEGHVLHSYSSPDSYFTFNVVQVDCGQSNYDGTIYECSTRLDLKIADGRIIRGYDKSGECDAIVKWLTD
jgi:hypothetical protein